MSFDVEDQDSGERQPFYGGASPNGYTILTDEGRMMVLITSGMRKLGQTDEKQAVLFRTMLSSTGLCRFEGDKFITTVDVSWNESWTGIDQVRFYRLDGDQLDIVTEWLPNFLTLSTELHVASFLGNERNDRWQVVRFSQSQ